MECEAFANDPCAIEYTQRFAEGHSLVLHGFRVGLFVVAPRVHNRHRRISYDGMRERWMRRWMVVHVPSSRLAGDSDSFDTAMMVADDVSRFALRDPETDDPEQCYRDLGPDVVAWIRHSFDHEPIPFRQWKAAQQRSGGNRS